MCCSVHIIVEESYDLQMNGARNHLALIVFQVDSFSIELRRKVTRRSFSRLVTCSIISEQCKDFLTGNSSYLSASRNRVEMYRDRHSSSPPACWLSPLHDPEEQQDQYYTTYTPSSSSDARQRSGKGSSDFLSSTQFSRGLCEWVGGSSSSSQRSNVIRLAWLPALLLLLLLRF